MLLKHHTLIGYAIYQAVMTDDAKIIKITISNCIDE